MASDSSRANARRIGLGLRSIDERVRLVRGTVQLESRPGHGTSLLVRVPLSKAPVEVTVEAEQTDP